MTMAILGRAAIGAGQMIGSQFINAKRPKYEIPKSEREALAMAKLRAADPSMPGEQRAIDRAMLAEANAVRGAQDSGNAMEVIPAIAAGTQSNLADIAAQSAQFQNQDLDRFDSALSRNAEYEDQEFQINEFAPYAQKYALKQQLFGAGMENATKALDQFALSGGVQSPGKLGSTASGNNITSTPPSAGGRFGNNIEMDNGTTLYGATPVIPGLAGMNREQLAMLMRVLQSGALN